MIPRPTKKVSAKERANLLKGGQKGNKGRQRQDPQIQAVARKLLSDSWYRRSLVNRLRSGTIQPGVEALLYYYAHGKPQETVENKGTPTAVTIIHNLRPKKDDSAE